MNTRMGLKKRFALLVLAIFLFLGLLTSLAFDFTLHQVTRHLGEEFVTQYAAKEKNRIQGIIDRELALSAKMVDSPLLKQWLAKESGRLPPMVREELESYRRAFHNKGYFIASRQTGHNYQYNGKPGVDDHLPAYTLDPKNPKDIWFYTTLDKVENFDLNIDIDETTDAEVKLWINMVVWNQNRKIGLAGTGLELGSFLQEILGHLPNGMTLILFAPNGAIHAHPNPAYLDRNTLSKSDHSTLFRLLPVAAQHEEVRQAMTRLKSSPDQTATFSLDLEGLDSLAAMLYIPSIDHFILVASDLSHLLGPQRFTPLLAVLGLSLLLLMLAISLLLNRQVLSPLDRLNDSVQRLARGDYHASTPSPRSDEIGDLSRAFHNMVTMVRNTTENLEDLVQERTRQVQQANQELNTIHQEMLSSLHYARLIQSNILPKPEQLEPHLPDLFLFWRPRDIVGGDFYWFHHGPNGCLLALIDCTGHGVPGALMTMTANAMLNHVANALENSNPALFLAHANRILRDTLHSGQLAPGMDNGMEMALCHWRPGEDFLTFAGAHLGLVRMHDTTLTEWRGDPHSLGYRRSNPDYPFTNQRVEILPGSAFYLVSDGLLDQSGGEKGFGFGKKRLLDLLTTMGHHPMSEQCRLMEEALQHYQGDHPQRDDITLLGFRISAEAHDPPSGSTP